jgi:2-oxoglutarate dehydrogenase E2 component (dihydrolipoamide succinyltransferase)
MKVDVVMPQLGESVAEGTIVKWLKKPGDSIARDESILEITTDKVDSEIPAPAAGTLAEILTQEGETVPVGTPIARIETGAAAVAAVGTEKPAAAEPARPSPRDTSVHDGSDRPGTKVIEYRRPGGRAAKPAAASRRFYSPLVRSIASKEGIPLEELETVAGSGTRGRVTKNDIMAYLETRTGGAAAPAAAVAAAPAVPRPSTPTQVIEMDHMRKAIAEHMVRSVQTSAHVTSISEADVTGIVRFREQNKEAFQRQEGIPLTYTPFFVQAVSGALKEFPFLNASVDGDSIVLKRDIHIGLAVSVADGKGLIVPVIRNADEKNFLGLARTIVDLSNRARTKKLNPDEVQGGTFTITNPGIYGGLIGTPIISQPQVAIIGTGAIVKRPVVIDDAIAIRSMVYLSLSYDHRIIDGAMGTQYLQRVVRDLESFDARELGWHAR